MGKVPVLHSLIPLGEFKTILGIDDREDALSRYSLVTATYTIEQHCKRRLLLKRHFERIAFHGELILPLGEYPVREMLAVYVQKIRFHADFLNRSFCSAKTPAKALETPPSVAVAGPGELLEPELYRVIPDFEEAEGLPEDMPYSLSLSPALNRGRGLAGVKAVYRAGPENISVNGDFSWPHAVPHYSSTRSMFRVHYVAGYGCGEAPADLASACLELAAWNMSRYRGRRIGLTGNVRGSGKDGEHLEASMPENVRGLLEPYRRRML